MPGISLPQRSFRQKPPIGSRFNAASPLARGLQALYVFNEGGGTSFAEASGQHTSATIGNGSGTPACWTNGAFGPAVQLTSAIGYISCSNICDNLANFSVSLWFQNSISSGAPLVVGKLGTGGTASGQGWGVLQDATKIGIFTQLNGGSTFRELDVSVAVNNGKWHHGVFTVSNYVPQNIYIDGVAVATTTLGSGTVNTTTNPANLTIGGDTHSDWYSGNLDVIGIWNRILTPDEVQRLYVQPLNLLTAPGQTLYSRGRIRTRGAVQTLMPAGIASSEAEGASLVCAGFNPLGITSAEAEGAIVVSQNLSPLAIASSESFGAIMTIARNDAPIDIALRRRVASNKPTAGTLPDKAHPLTQGLAAGWLLNDAGGFSATEVLTGIASGFAGSPAAPAWQTGQFGPTVHFPGGGGSGRIAVVSQPAFTDLGLNGPMSVSFWYNYDAAQITLPTGSSVMGKNDSTDGTTGFTHGWVVNSDNWHLVNGVPVNSGPQYIKLEFERSGWNKQGGIPAPTTANVWHHIVITTGGGASTPSINDYTIYLDGVLQQNTFFVAGTGTDTTSDAAYGLAIGSHPNGTSAFNGYLDTVLLYNRVLTSSEAQQLYTDPFCFMQYRTRRMRAKIPQNLSITPLGIFSAEQLGSVLTQTGQLVSPLGIVSSESLGADTVRPVLPPTTPRERLISPGKDYRIINVQL